MNKEYDNTVIEVIDIAHGQEVKKFWLEQGVDAASGYKYNGSTYKYYGVINGIFSNYNLDQVQSYGAKIITLPPSKIKYEFKEGDMIQCPTPDQAHSLLTLAAALGYKTSPYPHLDSFVYTSHFFYFVNKNYPHKREISPDDFVALITGRLPKYWCFDAEEVNSQFILDYLNKDDNWNYHANGRSNWGFYAKSHTYFVRSSNSQAFPDDKYFSLSVPYILQSIEEDKKYKTKFDNLPKSITPMQKINRIDVKEIYDNITCSEFRRRITEKLNEFPFESEIPVSDKEILEMYNAAGQSSKLTNILPKFFKKPKDRVNIITRFPTIDSDFFCINDKIAGNLFTEDASITEQKYDGHYPNIYLDDCHGTWRERNGNPISGYLYYIPKY